MIIERNVFHLKFGKAKEGIAIWKEILSVTKEVGKIPSMVLLSDLSGTAYTIVIEMTLKNFSDINPKNYTWVTDPRFQDLYQKFIPLCDSSERTYYTIEYDE
jgi:hypothetical protein